MNVDERNNLIEKLYLEDNLSMDQISRQFEISRNRIKQSLWKRGIKGYSQRFR